MHLEGFITDVTTKKLSEQRLISSNQRFKSVFDNAADGIVQTDRHGVVLSVNNAFEKITGISAKEVVGKSGFLLAKKFVSVNYLSDILIYIKNVLINNTKNKFILKSKDIYIEIHVGEKTDDNTYISILRDITERKVSEQLLAEQKDFSEKLIDTSSAIIIGLNRDHKIKIFSAGAERITGYKKNEVLDKDWFNIFIPDTIREQINNIWDKSWGKVSHSYKNVILTKEGKERIVSWQTTGVYDNIDRSKHLIIYIGEDITEKQRKDDLIKRNLKYQKMLTEVSSEFVGAYNIDNSVNIMLNGIGNFCNADRSYLFMISDEFQTMNNTNEWCVDGVEPHIHNLKNLSLKSFPWWMSKLRNNEIIYVEDVSKMPLEADSEKKILLAQKIDSVIVLPLNVNSKLCGFIGVDNIESFKGWQLQSVDMLKMSVEILSSALFRLNSEENLKESELYNKALFHYSNIPLVVMDIDTNEFHDCNLAAVKILGFNTQDEMYGKTALDVSTVTQYDGAPSDLLMKNKVMEVQRNGSCLFDWRFKRPNGELWDAELHLMKIKLLEKNLLKVSILDITEKRKAKEALRLKNIELQERNEELDAFSHTVAHDLKNPLGRILGYADLLSFDYDSTSKEEFKQYIQSIIESGEKTQQIINSLLLFASVRKAEMQTEDVDMSYVVHETIKRLSTEIERRNAKINVPKEFPIVCGYESWIEEVWTNYLTNAMKYSGENPQIDIGFDDGNVEGVPNGMIRFWVKDFGPGIPIEKQPIIFKQFERLSQVKTEGHGLGLSIVRRIIEKLGGEVGVKNGNNSGCVFYFTLPSSNCEYEK
jgi:PAS domain S-box-containing protein